MTENDSVLFEAIKQLLLTGQYLEAEQILRSPKRSFDSQLEFHLGVLARKGKFKPEVISALISNDLDKLRTEGKLFLQAQIQKKRVSEERLKNEKLKEEKFEKERAKEERQKEARRSLLSRLEKELSDSFLTVDDWFLAQRIDLLTLRDVELAKIQFIKKWIGENTPRDKNGSKREPDDEQAAAIAAVHGHVQVVARAGSGKTTTLVNRTLFLLKHCGIAPNEMLLLAFNRKAALEIRRRLLGLLHEGAEATVVAEVDRRIRDVGKHKRINRDDIEANAVDAIAITHHVALPHVMTFHALAYALVHPEESLLNNGADGQAQGLSRAFQHVIDDHMQKPSFNEKIRELMLAHFREDWDRIVEGCYDQCKDELLRFRRSLPKESIGGEYVKSYGEKVIADFLFEHDIAYKYERNHWWSGINYRPDFTIFQTPKSGTIIEYFGLKGDSDYDQMSVAKRAYWNAKKEWALIEFSPRDIVSGGIDSFLANLKNRLEDRGIPCIRLSEDELWHRVRDRAIDRFTTAMVGFIGRCRKQSFSPSTLRSVVDAYSPLSSVEKMFLELANLLYAAYLDRLAATGEEDFDGLMQRAADAVSTGQTLFQRKSGGGDLALLRYVCIDEFQDFSDLFYRLLNAIRKQNPEIELFCVGDDWQAINGFAGSDLRFFENFSDHIGESHRLYISTNYRSSNAIVTVGNALMEGFGKPAIVHKKSAGTVLVSDLNEFEPSLVEKQRHPGDIITPAVLRLANKALAEGLDVVMLCRRNALPWFVNFQDQVGGSGRGLTRYLDLIRSFFPKDLKERISISTAHKYKGLEKPMVIVLDAVARSYPLIHPDWAFSRVLGDSPEKIAKEERRLLYVALTRAVETLVIITDGRSKSPFLEELECRQPPSAIRWSEYPPVRGLTNQRLVVRIQDQINKTSRGGTFKIRDLLNASKYNWHAVGKHWEKSFPVDGFEINTVKAEVWAEAADGIKVQIFDEAGTIVACFLIDEGAFSGEVDELHSVQVAPAV